MTDGMRQQITPGIYPDVSFEEYVRWDAENASHLKWIDVSPWHYQAYKLGWKRFDSDAMRLGRLVHTGVLEPMHLEARYEVMPDYATHEGNVTKEGKPSKKGNTEWVFAQQAGYRERAELKGKEVVSRTEWESLYSVAMAISKCPVTSELFNQPGRVELSLCWEDPNSGLLCKCRLDKEGARHSQLIDLKSLARPERFNHQIGELKYYRQAAHYRKGWEVLTGEKWPFWFAPVGPVGDILCGARSAPLSEDLMELGDFENMEALEKVRYARESGEWPNMQSPEEWEGPRWLQAQIERDEDETLLESIA